MFAPRVLRITILAEVIYFTLSERRATIDHCHPYEKVPVLNGCYDQITIEGETVKYSCSFGDNYLAADVVYWRLRLEDRSIILIENKKNYTNFHMDAHQDCPLTNNSCCKFISELSIHTDLSMNDAILYCYALINGFTSDSMCNLSVVTKPKITVPLNNVRTKEGETVVLESLVTAVTISGWMLFTWKKNDHVINSNPHKYNFTTEINPYNNSIKYLLTIHSVSKEDDANYTLIVYYNADILKQHGITGDFSNQTTGVLQVDSKVNISLILGIATAAAVLVATILVVIFVCTIRKRKSCSARLKNRSAKSIISPLRIPDETSPLLPPSNHDGSDNDIQECSPVPATSDNNTILPDSEVSAYLEPIDMG